MDSEWEADWLDWIYGHSNSTLGDCEYEPISRFVQCLTALQYINTGPHLCKPIVSKSSIVWVIQIQYCNSVSVECVQDLSLDCITERSICSVVLSFGGKRVLTDLTMIIVTNMKQIAFKGWFSQRFHIKCMQKCGWSVEDCHKSSSDIR